MRFLRDQAAIETSEVAVIIAVVVLVAYGAYQLLGDASAQVDYSAIFSILHCIVE